MSDHDDKMMKNRLEEISKELLELAQTDRGEQELVDRCASLRKDPPALGLSFDDSGLDIYFEETQFDKDLMETSGKPGSETVHVGIPWSALDDALWDLEGEDDSMQVIGNLLEAIQRYERRVGYSHVEWLADQGKEKDRQGRTRPV